MKEVRTFDIDGLLANLAAAVAVQEQLAALVEARTVALRHADAAGMADAGRAEDEALKKAVAFERKRRTRTAELAATLGLAAEASLSEIAEQLPEPARTRVLAAREQLREAVAVNGQRATTAARAAAATATHVDALLRRITEHSIGGSHYAASGRHAPARRSLSRMSLTA